MSKLTLDNENQVFFYEQEFYVLSNFSAFNVDIWGHRFQTAEHAYHWRKFDYTPWVSIASLIKNAPSAHDAFKIAQEHRDKIPNNWKAVRLHIMLEILQAKAMQHEYVRRKLIETGNRELIENSWRDDFWGWGENRDGQNRLGKLWMEIRGQCEVHNLLQINHPSK